MGNNHQEAMIRKPSFRLGFSLWLAGMAGVLVTLLMPLAIPEGIELQLQPWIIKFLSLVQLTALLLFAVWVGVRLSPKVDLHAPAFEAFFRHQDAWAALRPQIMPGLIAGIIGGVGLAMFGFLTPDVLERADAVFRTPIATRILYGGITEELLLRWGVMTFFLWGAWRLSGRRKETPGPALVWIAIIVSALLFGAGHLPLAFNLAGEVTAGLVLYIIGANSIFGILFGYLFWRYGLEASMIAHILAHLVAYPLIPLFA